MQITLIASFVLTMVACQSGKQKQDTILILYPNWAEGIAFTNLAKVVLEDKGYDVKIKPIEPGPIYASIAKGDADLCLDAWLPHTHKKYWDKYGENINKLGESFSEGTTGMVVPAYVDIDSISQLNDNKEKFDEKIIGIGSGAGIYENTEKAIEAYGLELDQITSSGPAMMAALKKATSKEKWICVTGWKPHFMWADFDLKYLVDSKEIFPEDVCAIISRKGFEKDFPKVAEFLGNFNLEERDLYDLMDAIEVGDDPKESAKKWYQENNAMIDGWFPENE